MRYVHILAEAWELTTLTKKLTWFIFAPSVAFIIMFIVQISWQYSLFGEEFGWIEHGTTNEFIGDSVSAIHGSGMLWLVITLIAIGALLLFVLKPWIEATLMLSVEQRFSFPKKRYSLRKQISKGHKHFIHLLEYHALLAPFAPLSLILYTISFYRYTHGSDTFYTIFLPILIVLGVLSIFVHFFLIFMPFYLVCDKQELFKALTNSMGLVFRHFGKTTTLFLVMMLVSLRIIVNVIVIVGVPVGLISIATYFATSTYYSLFLIFAGILALILIVGAGYLTAVLEVFSTSFWYRAFQLFKSLDEADAIDESENNLAVIQPNAEQPKNVKVVHIVHHVQQGEPMPNPTHFTDIPGEITEIHDSEPLQPESHTIEENL
jgi:hypothetical protein